MKGLRNRPNLHWLDPVETGLAAECGGCGAAHFLLNVATSRPAEPGRSPTAPPEAFAAAPAEPGRSPTAPPEAFAANTTEPDLDLSS